MLVLLISTIAHLQAVSQENQIIEGDHPFSIRINGESKPPALVILSCKAGEIVLDTNDVEKIEPSWIKEFKVIKSEDVLKGYSVSANDYITFVSLKRKWEKRFLKYLDG